jgi:hypothetical protein
MRLFQVVLKCVLNPKRMKITSMRGVVIKLHGRIIEYALSKEGSPEFIALLYTLKPVLLKQDYKYMSVKNAFIMIKI